MRTTTLTPVLVATFCASLAATQAEAQSQGCQDKGFMGSGNQVVGTLAGAALGGLLGNNIGSSMDCADQFKHERTAQDAFERQPTGQVSTWQNPDTHTAGSVTPTRTWTRNDGVPCRDFQQTVTIEGRQETMTGTACRQNDGTWRVQG